MAIDKYIHGWIALENIMFLKEIALKRKKHEHFISDNISL